MTGVQVIKPMTDISSIRLVKKFCACGCGREFFTKWGSSQKYRSALCVRFENGYKHDPIKAWKKQNSYVVMG